MDNEYSNNEPQALRQKSQNFYPDGYYICTGVPGNGFYVRDNFKDDYSYPVPVDYAGKYFRKERLFRNDVSYKEVKASETNSRTTTEQPTENKNKIMRCVIFIIIAVLISLVFPSLSGFLCPVIVFSLLTLLPQKDRGNDKVYVNNPYRVYDKDVFERSRFLKPEPDQKLTQKIVIKVPYTKYTFMTPKVENIAEYYISTAETVAASLDDGIPKRIMQNYANVLRNPEAGNGFVADSLVDDETLDRFRDVCRSFEDLMLCSLVLREDFCSDYSSDTPDEIATSPASLFVGVFDYIGSQFDVPVFDFGGFKVYLYPSFVIRAYDAFTFEVFDYKDFGISVSEVWHKYTGAASRLLVHREGTGKYCNHCRFARITMKFGGGRYSVLVSNEERAEAFVSNLQKLS